MCQISVASLKLIYYEISTNVLPNSNLETCENNFHESQQESSASNRADENSMGTSIIKKTY